MNISSVYHQHLHMHKICRDKCQPRTRIFLHAKKKSFRCEIARKAPFYVYATLHGKFFMRKWDY